MGVMDRFLNAMRLNSDEDDYYDDDEFYDDDEDDVEDDYEPRRKSRLRSRRDEEDFGDEEDDDDYVAPKSSSASSGSRNVTQQTSSKVTPMRSSRRTTTSAHSPMQVCVIKPISVDDSREITDTLVSNQTVILNLEGLDLDVAQRIIDFSSGSCYAIGGNLQKVSNYIFVVTPPNVDISGDIQNIMSTFGDTSSLH